MPRIFGTFGFLEIFSTLNQYYRNADRTAYALGNPQVKATLRKLLEASDELEKRIQIFGPHAALGPAQRIPVAESGNVQSPL